MISDGHWAQLQRHQHAAVVLVHQERPPRQVGRRLQSQASDNTAILVDGSGSLVPANYVPFDYGGFFTATARTVRCRHRTWFGAGRLHGLQRPDRPTPCATTRRPSPGSRCRLRGVRTTSGTLPLAMPVSATASRSPLRLPTAKRTDENLACLGVDSRSQLWAIVRRALTPSSSRSVPMSSTSRPACSSTVPMASWRVSTRQRRADNRFWYVKAGLRERWTPLGHTVLYGEYKNGENDAAVRRFGAFQRAGWPTVPSVAAGLQLRSPDVGLRRRAGNRCGRHVALDVLPPPRSRRQRCQLGVTAGASSIPTTSST